MSVGCLEEVLAGFHGAWNQHYPAVMGVYCGSLVEEPVEIADKGGYPDLVVDGTGKLWIFWETSMWDVLDGEKQRIMYAWYDQSRKK